MKGDDVLSSVCFFVTRENSEKNLINPDRSRIQDFLITNPSPSSASCCCFCCSSSFSFSQLFFFLSSLFFIRRRLLLVFGFASPSSSSSSSLSLPSSYSSSSSSTSSLLLRRRCRRLLRLRLLRCRLIRRLRIFLSFEEADSQHVRIYLLHFCTKNTTGSLHKKDSSFQKQPEK